MAWGCRWSRHCTTAFQGLAGRAERGEELEVLVLGPGAPWPRLGVRWALAVAGRLRSHAGVAGWSAAGGPSHLGTSAPHSEPGVSAVGPRGAPSPTARRRA